MKRTTCATLMLVGALAAIALVGCSGGGAKPAAQGGGMQSGASAGGGSGGDMAWGYVASGERTKLRLMRAQSDHLVLDQAMVPTDTWIVVNLDQDGVPGRQVGLQLLKRGDWKSVTVPVTGASNRKVIVALFADKGIKGKFEYDPDKKTKSPDRPYVVDGQAVSVSVWMR